jgi:peroxiredoxin Q/BCP
MHRTKAGLSIVAAALAAALLLAGAAEALEVGQKAPDFTLAAPGGKQVKLADMLGKGPIVIFTFIQAFTAT